MYSEQQHYIVCKVKELAKELGRVPMRHEFEQMLPRINPDVLFGSYERLLQASGVMKITSPVEIVKKPKIEFDSIIDVLFEFNQKGILLPDRILTKGNTTMVIGDTHFPFASVANIMRTAMFAKIIKPTNIVQLGDLYDFYALSRFPRSRNCFSPFEEVSLGNEMAKRFWYELQKASPKSRCFQLLGNHDQRPHLRVLESAPDTEVFFSYKSVFEFPNVTTIWDIRDELELDGRLYFHYRKKLGTNAVHFGKSCIFGHTHREQLMRFDYGSGSVFEYNVGLFGDPTAKELSYTPSKVTHWTLGGIALIDDFGPRGLVESL